MWLDRPAEEVAYDPPKRRGRVGCILKKKLATREL
jgi:hypothetical protein